MCYSVMVCLCTPVCVTLPIHLYAVSPVFLSCCLSSCVFCPCVIILNACHLYVCVVPVCNYVFSYTYFILCFFLCSLLSVSFCCLLTITSTICMHIYPCVFLPQIFPQTFAIIPVCCHVKLFLNFFSVVYA